VKRAHGTLLVRCAASAFVMNSQGIVGGLVQNYELRIKHNFGGNVRVVLEFSGGCAGSVFICIIRG
jgi:hypothetical protein